MNYSYLAGNITTRAPIAIPSQYLWSGFLIVILMFVILSAILAYHWVTYGYKQKRTKLIGTIYLIGSFTFIIIATMALIAYSSSL